MTKKSAFSEFFIPKIWEQKSGFQYFYIARCSFHSYRFISKGVAYVETTEAGKIYMPKKDIKTIKLYFHVLNKGTMNKLTD